MCQSHTGRLTGLWFLPKPAFGLNTNDDDDIYIYIFLVVNRLLDFSHHGCRFSASSELKSSASKPFQLPFPTLLRVVLIVFIPMTRSLFAHLLSSIHITCPYHFNMFSNLSRIVSVARIFLSWFRFWLFFFLVWKSCSSSKIHLRCIYEC